jgi:hypothetical protein
LEGGLDNFLENFSKYFQKLSTKRPKFPNTVAHPVHNPLG